MNDDDKLGLALIRDVLGVAAVGFVYAATDAPIVMVGLVVAFADLGRTIAKSLKDAKLGPALTAAELQQIKQYANRVQQQLTLATSKASPGTEAYNQCIKIQLVLLEIMKSLDKAKPKKLRAADYEQYVADIETYSKQLGDLARRLN